MKKKKAISAVLAASMLAAVILPGCGSDENSGKTEIEILQYKPEAATYFDQVEEQIQRPLKRLKLHRQRRLHGKSSFLKAFQANHHKLRRVTQTEVDGVGPQPPADGHNAFSAPVKPVAVAGKEAEIRGEHAP